MVYLPCDFPFSSLFPHLQLDLSFVLQHQVFGLSAAWWSGGGGVEYGWALMVDEGSVGVDR